MNSFASNPFGTVITAMVTPFKDDLSINLEAAQNIADFLIKNGSDGIVVAGTTGESPTLTVTEKIELLRAVLEVAKGRATIIAGTGNNNTSASIELSIKAEEAGADAAMLVVPYYNKPPQEGLYAHFKQIASNIDLPVLLYNVPARTACNLEADTVIRLSQVRNIKGIKEAGGDLGAVTKIIESTDDDFCLLCGQDEWNLPYLALGADGFISVASHIVGPQLARMRQLFNQGNSDGALEIHQQLLSIFKTLFITTNPIMVKAAVNLIGLSAGGLRLPLLQATEQQIAILRRDMEKLGLL